MNIILFLFLPKSIIKNPNSTLTYFSKKEHIIYFIILYELKNSIYFEIRLFNYLIQYPIII